MGPLYCTVLHAAIANNENERAPKAGASMQRPEITHDTKVSVSISGGESSAAAGPAAAGGLHIPGVAGIPAAAAAGAGRGPAAGQPGAAAAGTASSGPAKPLPPWLQGKQQQQAPSQVGGVVGMFAYGHKRYCVAYHSSN